MSDFAGCSIPLHSEFIDVGQHGGVLKVRGVGLLILYQPPNEQPLDRTRMRRNKDEGKTVRF
jgi:hypothetical protein